MRAPSQSQKGHFSDKTKLKKRDQNCWHWQNSAQSSEIFVTSRGICPSVGVSSRKGEHFLFWTKMVRTKIKPGLCHHLKQNVRSDKNVLQSWTGLFDMKVIEEHMHARENLLVKKFSATEPMRYSRYSICSFLAISMSPLNNTEKTLEEMACIV